MRFNSAKIRSHAKLKYHNPIVSHVYLVLLHQYLHLIQAQPQTNLVDFYTIQAMAILREEGVDAHLILFGHETEYSRVLKDLGRDLGVSDKIFFHDFMHHPAAIYDLIDSLAITSRAEAFGRTPFEATEAGVPIVYSQSGGLIEHMVPGITGLPYSNGNIQELANAIKMLALNP